MEKIIKEFLKDKAFQQGVINVSEIFFDSRYADICKSNGCGRYNKSWSCPPAVGNFEYVTERAKKYNKAYIFSTKSDLEDAYDVEGMDEARTTHTDLTNELISLLKENNKEFMPLGAGSCNICEKCTYPDAPCRFPEKVYPSIESYCIDVSRMTKTLNINYINGANTVTYFSAIFFNEEK